MHVKHVVLAGLTGLVLATGGFMGYVLITGAQNVSQAQEIKVVRPSYTSTRDIFEKLHPTCRSYRVVRPLGGENAAATCTMEGKTARIGLYEALSDVADALDSSKGRGMYGDKLVVVAGVNWAVNYPASNASPQLADEIASRLGGAVIFR